MFAKHCVLAPGAVVKARGHGGAFMVDGTPPRARRREHRHFKALQRQLLNLRLDRWGTLLLALCGTYVASTMLSIIPQVGQPSPKRMGSRTSHATPTRRATPTSGVGRRIRRPVV